MDIPMRAVLEGVASMIERSVLPELSTKYTKGQARAAIILLKDLVVQLEAREAALAEEIDSLATALQGIVEGVEGIETLAPDPALRALGERIRSALSQNHPGLEEKSQALCALLDSCIPVLAEAEREALGPSREALSQMRRAIRAHLRRQLEIQARSALPLAMDELSKAQ